MTIDQQNLIWVDLEMTGLEPQQDEIIEIATVVTDKHLNILAQGPVIAIHQPDNVLAGMDAWNTEHHGESGLTERVRQSRNTMSDAESETIDFLKQYVPQGASPMCGNSICQDRRFMARQMPQLEAFFHYRNLDVSTLKELANRWKPEILAGFVKKGAHLALDDILESIDELKYFREHFIRL
jgi:oligoribonuclease